MRNFQKRVPEYYQGDFVPYDNKICVVLSEIGGAIRLFESNYQFFTKTSKCKSISISIEWLTKFGYSITTKIKNVNSGEDWIIKQVSENCFYFTKDKVENPIIGLNYVHEFQGCLRRLNHNIFLSPNM